MTVHLAWHASLWAMERELGLISLCNLARAPTNFQFFPADRIFCTICHPDTTSAREAMKAQPGKHEKLSWFKQNTVRVDQLTDHYEQGSALAIAPCQLYLTASLGTRKSS